MRPSPIVTGSIWRRMRSTFGLRHARLTTKCERPRRSGSGIRNWLTVATRTPIAYAVMSPAQRTSARMMMPFQATGARAGTPKMSYEFRMPVMTPVIPRITTIGNR